MTSTGCRLSLRAQASPPKPAPTITTRGRSLIDDDAKLSVRLAQSGLHGVGRLATGEDETEVAIALRQRDQRLAGRNGDDQTIDPDDAARLGLAGDLPQHAGLADGQHHHPGGAAFAHVLGKRQAGGFPEDELLQRDARAKPKRARAQPTDRSRRDFEDPRTGRGKAKLAVDRTV